MKTTMNRPRPADASLVLRRGFFDAVLAETDGADASPSHTSTIIDRQEQLLAMSGKAFEAALGRHEKRQLGRAAKACIDLGRACGMLRTRRWEFVHLIRYAPEETTKENLLLVGLP